MALLIIYCVHGAAVHQKTVVSVMTVNVLIEGVNQLVVFICTFVYICADSMRSPVCASQLLFP